MLNAVFLHEQHLLIFYVNWKTWTNVEIFTEGKLYAFSPNNFINNNNISQNIQNIAENFLFYTGESGYVRSLSMIKATL